MRNVRDIGDDLAAPEHRRNDIDVRKMGAAARIRIVRHEHITPGQI